MSIGIGWIDFSKKHRDILKSVLDALSEKGVVDELGIGSVRNSIADVLFPGISTIQTRAKYFILVVQVIAEYKGNYQWNKKFESLNDFLQRRENEIIKELAKKYDGTDEKGVIGINAARRNKELQRKPSSIYWNGIRIHGLIHTDLSLSEYLGQFSIKRISGRTARKSNDEWGFDDDDAGRSDRFGLNLPKNIRGIKELSIKLSKDEAAFLKHCFSNPSMQESLLSTLLKADDLAREFVGYSSYREMVHGLKNKHISKDIMGVMELGEQFDFIIHGAHIRYNYLLNKELAEEKWDSWVEKLKERKQTIKKFDFLQLKSISSRVKKRTLFFLEEWISEISKEELNIKKLDELIIGQERWNKKKMARLSATPRELVDSWIGLGSGEHSMSFRFGNAKRIIDDILEGLKSM